MLPSQPSCDDESVRVRAAEWRDALAIATVHVLAWRAAYRGLIGDDYLASLDPDANVGGIAALIEQDDSPLRCYVLDAEADVAGFVFAGPSRDEDADERTGEVASIYVHPDRWRSGGGTMLLSAAGDALRLRGMDVATLWVLQENMIGRSFYERRGWSADGAEKSIEVGGHALTEVRYGVRI